LQKADVFVPKVNVHEVAELSIVVEQMAAKVGIFRRQILERLAHGLGFHNDRFLLPRVLPKGRWDEYGNWHSISSFQWLSRRAALKPLPFWMREKR
jgi:hypothetical protein